MSAVTDSAHAAAAESVSSRLSESRTASILTDLVRTRSQNPHDGEARIAGYVAAFLERLGLEVTVQEVFPGRANVVGRPRGAGDGGQALAFNTHMDTVPEGTGWTREPFGGEIVDGKLYGRGA